MLTLRVRMPIVADLVYPRNFITKIIKCGGGAALQLSARGAAAGSLWGGGPVLLCLAVPMGRLAAGTPGARAGAGAAHVLGLPAFLPSPLPPRPFPQV